VAALTSPASSEPSNPLAELVSLLPALAPSEQRVGRVILRDPANAAHLTISEVASLAETSETTVIRFCKSLGFASYPSLRISLATAAGRADAEPVARLSPDIDEDDDIQSIIAKVGAADVRAIADTIANLSSSELDRAVTAVSAARRVEAYGVGASGYVALDLQQKLHRIGLTAFAWTDPHTAIPSAANLTSADVAIAISHTGTTMDTIDALSQARSAGATTVAVTNYARSPIIRVADITLRTSVSETPLRAGAMASRIAELAVIDCLFIAVAQRQYPKTLTALARTRDSVQSRHQSLQR
jgi:DNA-binding MurR/RpiR family transcriptional regulator